MLIQKKILSLIFVHIFTFSLTTSPMNIETVVTPFYTTIKKNKEATICASIVIFLIVVQTVRSCCIKRKINAVNRRIKKHTKKNTSLHSNYESFDYINKKKNYTNNSNELYNKSQMKDDLKHMLDLTPMGLTFDNWLKWRGKKVGFRGLNKPYVTNLETNDSCIRKIIDSGVYPHKKKAMNLAFTLFQIWDKDKINNIKYSSISSDLEFSQIHRNSDIGTHINNLSDNE